ncbi:MAG: aminopeptidase N, partial [Novosphingobium sp.]
MDISAAPPAPKIIHREDYRPPEWLVPEVTLAFNLGIEQTRVVATLKVQRNGQGQTLRLNGDGIAAEAVLVDGKPSNAWRMDGDDLLVDLPGDRHEVSVATQIDPKANTQLMGLYASNGMLCTQCEAEGFRRIAFFPDRPDVLSVYTVHMEGPKDQFPVLLSNGNCIASSEGADGTHSATWHDPWPKPSYLFALVAGDLVANSDSFTTCSGRKVDLNIWVREGDQDRTHHAMQALKDSMKWDEETFGREYDLDLFNIVAVSDFNMGAMENKGLNVFNTRYILADPDTATDMDYDGIEGVVAHEYFHNWSGNRVTCRDWFQLSLKEGFTVLRDQLFSQDMGSEAVKRIEDVRVLRGAQFPEDSGPLAHPIRPDSYQEISNFYTATVYNKGAEVIRMMRTLVGPQRFRTGTDLYFDRHDGEAATCEDFVKAIEDGAEIDLSQFRLWYSQAGTPKVTARLSHEDDVATLTLRQDLPASPGQPQKLPMVIPLRLALFDSKTGRHDGEKLVVLDRAEMEFAFPGFSARP